MLNKALAVGDKREQPFWFFINVNVIITAFDESHTIHARSMPCVRCRCLPGMSEGEETWTYVYGGEGGSSGITREESPVIRDLRSGARYRFKTRAKTVFGWSPEGLVSEVYTTSRRF